MLILAKVHQQRLHHLPILHWLRYVSGKVTFVFFATMWAGLNIYPVFYGGSLCSDNKKGGFKRISPFFIYQSIL
jgi:hypothetical protein